MRFLTLLLPLLLLGSDALAQITITRSDVEALIGETRTRTDYAATGPGATIQALIDASGANQTWDFTTLAYDAGTPATETYTTSAPDGAPGADEAPFNTASLVSTQEIGADSVNYSFLDLRSDGAYFLGFSSTSNGSESERGTYDQAIRNFALPLSFGTAWTSSATVTVTADGQSFTVQEDRDLEADGYGTIVLPTGSFEVLRVRQTITATASGFTTTQTLYTWYDASFGALASVIAIEVPVVGVTYTATYSEIDGDPGGGTTPPATAPTGLTPADGASDQPTDLTLGWNGVAEATSYDLQVADNASFSKAMTVLVDEQGLTATSFAVSDLADDATYYWRVRGRNDGGTGPWATQTFTTASATVDAPEAVTLSTPPDGAADVPTTLTLAWQTAADAASYRVQVAETDAFATPTVDDAGLTTTSLEVEGLATGATYYWRVRATNAGGDGPWSAVRSFTTATNVSVEDGATLPTTPRLYANYPNPFNPTTTLRFALPQAGPVTLTIYDATGRRVAQPVSGTLPAGVHTVTFAAHALPSGLYLYALRTGQVYLTRTMALLK
ncbi:MAG: T9SS type A sorting domain-containing protein [Bacteroidetes bacterium]|jgi:hypothetical protein|nr:T9SS type A sorting domain-containing protein [Bacteroidota bacterium]